MNRPTSLALIGALAVSGCGLFAAPPRPVASAATVAACRTRTDEVFARQNRYLLSERDTRDAPFSTSGDTGITTAGLSSRYARDNLYDSCVGANAPDSGNGPAFSPGQTPSGPASQP